MSTPPLKVLQVISSSATSGAERHVLDLSEALVGQGHRVELICPSEGWLTETAERAGLSVHISPMKGQGWFQTLSLIGKLTMRGHVDLIHTHLTRAAYIGYSAGLLTGKPVITSVHIANNDAIYRRLAHRKNRLVAVSGFVRGMLHGRGVPDRYIDTVYNGTDFLGYEVAEPSEVKDELGIPRDRRVIGLIGRICRDKGHIEMVQALRRVCKRHPEAHAVFVGRVEQGFESEIHDLVRREGLVDRITFTGLRTDVARMLDACEIAAMPSRMETFGIAAIEAMARSRPVVASRVGALPEVVRHGQTGLLVESNPEELAEAVAYLLDEERIRLEMGECARKLVEEKFSIPQMAHRFEQVYAKALGLHPAAVA
jgi:glycosyltransferase involved in cell wall biosynthesis